MSIRDFWYVQVFTFGPIDSSQSMVSIPTTVSVIFGTKKSKEDCWKNERESRVDASSILPGLKFHRM